MKNRNSLDWQARLDRFLADLPWRRQINGVLVCGSYITGRPSKRSDLDVHLLLKSGTRWRERGNKIVGGLLIEYFANPPAQLRAYFREDHAVHRRVAAVQFATGRVLRDETGDVFRLVAEAQRWLRKPFSRLTTIQQEVTRYALWDAFDNLGGLAETKDPSLAHAYHAILRQILDSRCKQLGLPVLPANQAKALLTDKTTQRKYLMSAFPDRTFCRQWIAAMRETNPRRFTHHARLLVRRITGPFSIDGWRLRTSAVVS